MVAKWGKATKFLIFSIFRSLGIRKIRRLNMSRGGREGNNALTKDSDIRMTCPDFVGFALANNVPQKTINEMISLKLCTGDIFFTSEDDSYGILFAPHLLI